MAFATTTGELPRSFPSSVSSLDQTNNIPHHRHIGTAFFVHVYAEDAVVLHDRGVEANTPFRKGSNTDNVGFVSVLEACANVKQLKEIHAYVLKNELDQDISVSTKLASTYAMCANMESARLVFDKTHSPDTYLWNVMIRGYARNGLCEKALALYYQMPMAGMQPDKFTFPFVLTACAGLSALKDGQEIHARSVRGGFASDAFVGNSLISMYAKCRKIESARQVFDKMSKRDEVSWNAMSAGYAQNGHANEALALFHQLQLTEVTPNCVTLVSVLQACAHLAALQQGKGVHCYIIRRGIRSNIIVENALIDMYDKCGSIEIARQLFDEMSERDVVSWNAMIPGYARGEHPDEALSLFNQMRLTDTLPDSITIVAALLACAHLKALEEGKRIHDYIITSGFESNVVVGTALVNMCQVWEHRCCTPIV